MKRCFRSEISTEGNEMKYCSQCGKELVDEAVVCPNCGAPAAKTFSASGIKFEGSGFYNTDQRSGGSSTTATSGCCANCPHNH